jgi:hypothetical protein
MQLPVWLFWIIGVLLITWFIAGDDPLPDDREREGFCLLWYDTSMKNNINVNGVSFRLLEDGSLLLTTPTGQYQVQPQGVADLFDLLSAGQVGFLDASSNLPTWAREHAPDRLVLGHVQVDEEPPRSLDTYREHRGQR